MAVCTHVSLTSSTGYDVSRCTSQLAPNVYKIFFAINSFSLILMLEHRIKWVKRLCCLPSYHLGYTMVVLATCHQVISWRLFLSKRVLASFSGPVPYGFGSLRAHANSPRRKLAPTITPSNMISEGEKSLYWVKNIKRMGKTMYEFTVTKFPSKKKFLGKLWSMEVGVSLLGGEFDCARVNPLPCHTMTPWSNEQKEISPLLIPCSITVEASKPFEPIRVAAGGCDQHAQQHNGEAWYTVKSHV